MNRLTAIGLASLVAHGLLLTSKYTGFVSAARDDRGMVASLDDAPTVGSAVVGRVGAEPALRSMSLPPPIPRAEPMRASPSAVEFRAARDLKAFADGLMARRDSLTGDERYHLAKVLEECAFTTTINEDLAVYSAKQRRQFISGLTPSDASNTKRIAAYDAVDNTQRCMRFQGTRISQKEVDDIYLAAAQQGDARAQARILVAELNAKMATARNSADAAPARVMPDQFAQMIGLLQSREPEAMMIVGGFLAQNAVANTLHVGPNGEVPEPAAFLGGFSLASCEVGPDCLVTNREPQMACAYGGYCNSATFDELYSNFMASPWTYTQAMRYRNLILTAINTSNWALIGLTPPVANQASQSPQ
jgi:hypothetical protein